MLSSERKEVLLSRLRLDGRIVATEMASELQVSDDSIRRDLRELAAAGLCQRVYGGALPVAPAAADFAARESIAVDSKKRVATKALELIQPGMTVFLDGGTTALLVAQRLPRERALTVITHSPVVAMALLDAPAVEVDLIGGRMFRHSAVTSGAAAAEQLARVSVDLFLLGVTGVHPQHGLTTGDSGDAAMKRMIAGRAAETWVLASREKIGAASPFAVVTFDDVAGIITDAPSDDPAVSGLADSGTIVLMA
ncbi:MAG: DeoR/GlpR family DNA-binding transcription regulator [Mycetocola sp.]